MKKKKYQSPLIIQNNLNINISDDNQIDLIEDDISCLSETESLTTKSSSTINLKRYFGINARTEFGRRIKWLSNQRKLLYHQRDELLEKTRFESSYDGHSHSHSHNNNNNHNNSNNHNNDNNTQITTTNGGDERFSVLDDDNISVDSFDIPTVKEDIQEGTITSPRTKYIAACLKQNMNPRMSLILRKRISSELNLQHQGMGDTLGLLFADSLKELPYVQSINISDNNLTDVSIGPILRSIISMANVTSLNISNNMIDSKSTRALADYLKSPSCSIKRLILQKSDIDDSECHMFVEALKYNSSLIDLDLSNNKIGQAETLNTVQPDYITGGEAIADMLASNLCKLQTLNLAWNLIRLDGGISLAGCLKTNKYVTFLDLSYNALGKDGGEVLGSALLGNSILETLLLTNNNINFSACFAICVALEENFSLRRLALDGNPIGEGGGRSVMQIPFTTGSRVKVTASGCNLLIKDQNSSFNYSQPNDFYVLQLNNPYHRAVCIKLLRLVANHETYVFLRFAYSQDNKPITKPNSSSSNNNGNNNNNSNNSNNKSKKNNDGLISQYKDKEDYFIPSSAHEIKLVREYSAEKEERLDSYQIETLQNLRVIQQAATDVSIARDMFRKFDSDNSGSLDRLELKDLLQQVGLHLENEVFEQAMDMCDIDGSGELDEDEFLDFIRCQKDEATNRIKDLTEYPIMVLESDRNKRYVPPYEGTLYILVGDSFNHKGARKIVTAVDHSNMMDVIRKGVDNIATVLEFCIQSTYLRQREAIHIFNAMHLEIKDPAIVVSKILPRMADPIEARSLMMQVINFDKVALRRLMIILGNAFYPLLGIYDGYYSLDMSIETDRICMSKLLIQSQLYKDQCMEKCLFQERKTRDLSQKGDWSAFRNEIIDGEPGHVSIELFNPIPTKGKISFDFSGSVKAPREAAVIKDTRCVNVLINLCLVHRNQREELLQDLQNMQNIPKSSFKFDGKYETYFTRLKAEEYQLCMSKFYSRLPKRTSEYRKAIRSEIVRHANDQNSANIPVLQDEESDSDDSIDSISHLVYDDNELAEVERQTEIDLALLEFSTLPASKKDKFQKSESKPLNIRRGAILKTELSKTFNEETNTLPFFEHDNNNNSNSNINNNKDNSSNNNTTKNSNNIIEEVDSDVDSENFEFNLDDDDDDYYEDGDENNENEENKNNKFKKESKQQQQQLITTNTPLTPTSTLNSNLNSTTLTTLTTEAVGKLPSINKKVEPKKKMKNLFNLTRSSAYIADYSSIITKKSDNTFNANIKASRIVLAIVDILSRVYIKSRHLALILKWFPLGRTHKTRHFGTYRVELAVLLYNRIVDIHNLDLVGRVLTIYEWACFTCRIGILNIYNPLKPEGPMCLDMSRRDERKVAEILTALSVIEPGENWIESSFRWTYDSPTIPGWELTQSWLTAESIPDKGIVYVNYYSGEGQKIKGCVADIPARKALLALVRIDEADIIHDDDNINEDGSRIHSKLVGLHYAQNHIGLWNSLLAPTNSTSARLGAGESFTSVFPNCSYIRARNTKNENQSDSSNIPSSSSPDKLKKLNSTVGTSSSSSNTLSPSTSSPNKKTKVSKKVTKK